MNQVKAYIDSGILETYVIGVASEEEATEVERMATQYPVIQREIEQIRSTIEAYAKQNAVAPPETVKPLLLATIDYTERLKSGEPVTFPPSLGHHSQMSEYESWTNRADMVLPAESDEIFVKLIGYTPEDTTAIVWIKSMAPYEVHDDTFEKFLILEGTCDIDIDGDIHSLKKGDYLSIPLHKGHTVKVTSPIPCKVLLQRTAA